MTPVLRTERAGLPLALVLAAMAVLCVAVTAAAALYPSPSTPVLTGPPLTTGTDAVLTVGCPATRSDR